VIVFIFHVNTYRSLAFIQRGISEYCIVRTKLSKLFKNGTPTSTDCCTARTTSQQ